VHRAHVALAQVALETLGLDELRWLPAGQPWQKQRSLAPAEHRLAMLHLAVVGLPRCVVDGRELLRTGPSYTHDTVRELQAEHAEQAQQAASGQACTWHLVIGGDQLANFHTWHAWRELLAAVHLAVAARAGAALNGHAEVLAALHARGRVLPLPALMVSSTDIRARVAAGAPFSHLVPAAVAGYIDQQSLYRSGVHRS
jgi:nicotinate-nucleotide adenylyltransferase